MVATGNEAVSLSQLKSVSSVQAEEVAREYSTTGSTVEFEVAVGFMIELTYPGNPTIHTLETPTSVKITAFEGGSSSDFTLYGPEGSTVSFEDAATVSSLGRTYPMTSSVKSDSGVNYHTSVMLYDSVEYPVPPSIWIASQSSGASGREPSTVGQAALALGIEPTANSAVADRAISLRQLKMAYDSAHSLEIVSWADGTDEQVAAMVAAADAGQIDLSDYWSAGDTRTVQLSAMPATGVSESHAAQSVQFVLTDPGHYTLANGKKCNFVVLQKDCLKESGVMNSQGTNSGGWNNCPRRTWCNSVYRNAIPASLRPIFKQFKVRTANGSGSGVTESTDYFSLFSKKEIFGSTTYANSSAESKNSQLTWFKTSSNRIKKVNGSAYHWWERSPCSGRSNSFCYVNTRSSAGWGAASGSRGLAPFGCI